METISPLKICSLIPLKTSIASDQRERVFLLSSNSRKICFSNRVFAHFQVQKFYSSSPHTCTVYRGEPVGIFVFSMLMPSLLVSFSQNDSVFCNDLDVIHLELCIDHQDLIYTLFLALLAVSL